jgi:hypothetical protein
VYPEASGEEAVPKSNLYVFGSAEVAVGFGEGVLDDKTEPEDNWFGVGVFVFVGAGTPIVGLGSGVDVLAAVGFPDVGVGAAVEFKVAVGLFAVGLTGF